MYIVTTKKAKSRKTAFSRTQDTITPANASETQEIEETGMSFCILFLKIFYFKVTT